MSRTLSLRSCCRWLALLCACGALAAAPLAAQRPWTLPVWQYNQGSYSLLGYQPIVDAALRAPAFWPLFNYRLSSALQQLARSASYSALVVYYLRQSAFLGDGVGGAAPPAPAAATPPAFAAAFGAQAAPLYDSWRQLVALNRAAERLLAPLTAAERDLLRHKWQTFFFGVKDDGQYDFFTSDSLQPFYLYSLVRKVDLAALIALLPRATALAERLRSLAAALPAADPQLYFEWHDGPYSMVIAGPGDHVHTKPSTLMIDLGGDDQYNYDHDSGDPVTITIDLSGDDRYQTAEGGPGAALLGVAVHIDGAGADRYLAKRRGQGTAVLGAALFVDEQGDDRYEGRFFAQGAALFGAALFIDRSGDDSYSVGGFGQGAASTLGSALLLDGRGDDLYTLEQGSEDPFTIPFGIGQGAAVGVRLYPWENGPSLYGGYALLSDGAGDDAYRGGLFSQGSAYFLGAAALVDHSGNDSYSATIDSQGQGLHLAAGLLLDEDGDDSYQASWGSQGVAGDRSLGILIDGGGADSYSAGIHGLATARKPNALGIVIEGGGDDQYSFSSGNGVVSWPEAPLEWPKALFVDFQGVDSYPAVEDGMRRGNGLRWGDIPHSLAVDLPAAAPLPMKFLWQYLAGLLPVEGLAYDPRRGWSTTASLRPSRAPASAEQLSAFLHTLITAPQGVGRSDLEALDLARFTAHSDDAWLALPQALDQRPVDPMLMSYLLTLWRFEKYRDGAAATAQALADEALPGDLLPLQALRYLHFVDSRLSLPAAHSLLGQQGGATLRSAAAHLLAQSADPVYWQAVAAALNDPSPAVRYAAAWGLQGSPLPDAAAALRPLLADGDPYVRRAAAFSLLTLGERQAAVALFEAMAAMPPSAVNALDDSFFSQLVRLLGVDYGRDVAAWLQWARRQQAQGS